MDELVAGVQDVVAPATSPIGLTLDAGGLSPLAAVETSSWRPVLRRYEGPDWRSGFQLVTAVAMLVSGWVLAVRALEVHYVLTLLSTAVIAVAIMRCFILFHDCGHGSFSRSRRLNDIVGSVLGIVVFTPFRYWNYAHAMHHATSSDLDRRGVGDVWTMTVPEFRAASRFRRAYYRCYHSPWVMFTIGPLIKFGVIERIVTRPATTPARIKRSVHLTNAGIVAYAAAMTALLGPGRFLAVQLPALVIGGSGAIWLFYVQHRFEAAYWTRRSEWRYVDAAFLGSSHLQLGPVLQYMSGNIGFHHLHHLDSRIPNYNLPRCSRDHPELRASRVLTLRDSLEARHLKLWDEETGRYVGFEAAGRRPLAEELVDNLGLVGLFLAAMLAASVLPFPVEAVVPVMVARGYSSLGIVLAGTAGGYAGSLVNYHLAARGEEWWRLHRPERTRWLDRMHTAFTRWGSPVLILSWLPVLGETLTLAAGMARVRLSTFSFWTILGRALRMVGLVHLSLLLF